MSAPKFEQTEGGMCVTIMRNTILHTRTTTIVADKVPHKYHTSTTQVKSLWDSMQDGKEYSSTELMSLVGIKNRSHFVKTILQVSVRDEIIEPIYPEQPRHPRQKYRRKKL